MRRAYLQLESAGLDCYGIRRKEREAQAARQVFRYVDLATGRIASPVVALRHRLRGLGGERVRELTDEKLEEFIAWAAGEIRMMELNA